MTVLGAGDDFAAPEQRVGERIAAVSPPTVSATLLQTIATSAWNPASPDPVGRAAAQPLTIDRQGNVSSSSEAAGLRPIPPRSCVLD